LATIGLNQIIGDIIDFYLRPGSPSKSSHTNANPFDLIASLQKKYHTFLTDKVVAEEESKYVFSHELKDYPQADRVMTTCAFSKTHDHLLQGELYDLPRVDGKPYNCWMLFSNWGAPSIHQKHISELVERLANTGAKEVICFHDDCYNTLAALAPELGIEVPSARFIFQNT